MIASLRGRVASLLPLSGPGPRSGDGRPVDSVDRSPLALAQMPPWRRSLTRPALLWAAAALAFAAGQLVLRFLLDAFGETPGALTAGVLWGPALAAASGYALVLLLEQRRPHELTSRPWAHLGRGLLAGAVLSFLVVLVMAALQQVWVHGGSLDLGVHDGDDYGGWPLWVGVVLLVAFAPAVTQGLLLCGVVLRYAEQLLGTWGGLMVTAVAAGALATRADDVSVRVVLAAGLWALLLATLYVLTRSLWFVIGLQAAWHFVRGPVLGLREPGDLEWSSLLWTSLSRAWAEPAAGLEAHLVTLIAVGAVTLWAMVVLARRGSAVPPAWAGARRPGQADSRA